MQKRSLALTGMLLLKFILSSALVNGAYELQRDEFLHLDQGRHLAWGYISVPPFTSWISYLILQLGGNVFWVKFFPAAFGALTILLLWKLVEKLGGGLFACLVAALALQFSALLRINILYQPNSLDIFFWTLTYFCFIRYVQTAGLKWLYVAALSFAFGFLSKYTILFMAAGLLPALLLSRHRKILANRHFYLALLLALAVISPNLYWQYAHHFPTLLQWKELAATQLVNVSRLEFLKDQLLFFVPGLFVLLAAFAGLLFYPPFTRYRFLLLSYVITLLLLVFFKAKSYYALGLYPVLLAFGATYLERILENGRRRHLRTLCVAALLVLAVPYGLLVMPLFSPAYYKTHPQPFRQLGLLRWEDGKDHPLPQDFADMLGWKELAGKADAFYKTLPEKESTRLICDNYGQAGAINYYTKEGLRAVSLNADYMNWIPLNKTIKHVLLVKDNFDTDSTRQREGALFERVRLLGQIENPYAREYGTKIYLLENARTDINALIEKEVSERKKGRR